MKINDVKFGFPVNKTIMCSAGVNKDFPEITKAAKGINSPCNLRVVLYCTADEKKFWTTDKINELFDENVESLKVVYNTEKISNERSKKILQVKSVEEKLTEYCKVNEIEATESIIEKAKEIENSSLIKYKSPDRSFTLLKVSLRGSIGLKEGIGVDEFEIDFRDYDPGIIAVCGKNGSGKSTFIENCHPYNRMLSKSGKLQDHFFLKDSYRKLLYTDDKGMYYQIEFLIDGKTKNGKVKYFVYEGKSEKDMTAVAGIDGNTDSYEKWVEETFGSISLFLRTCFFAKESTNGVPDISQATKGEKKELFSTLIGISQYDEYSELAHEKVKELKDEIKSVKRSLDSLESQCDEETYEYIKDNIINHERKVARYKKIVENLKAELEEVEKSLVEVRKYSDKTERLKQIQSNLDALYNKKKFIETYESGKEKNESLMKMTDEKELLSNEISTTRTELEHNKISLEKFNLDIKTVSTEISSLEKEIKLLKKSLPDVSSGLCPTCGNPLSSHKQEEIEAERNEILTKISELENTCKDKLEEKTVRETTCADYSELNIKPLEEKLDKLETKLDDLTDKLGGFNKNVYVSLTLKYENVKSEYNENEVESLEKEMNDIKDYLSNISLDEPALLKRVDEIKKDISENENQVEIQTFRAGATREKLNTIEEAMKRKKEVTEELKKLLKTSEDYSLLEKAFGKDGIQALELEAIAPSVADTTNEILSNAYGDKFKISFETLRLGSSGQLIEDFNILVEDTETGTERPLEWLSSGEAVWIKEALYNAFTIERSRFTGFNFKTRFLDESDGSLDSSARLKYLKMIQAAHDSGDTVHTVIITHSQELKDLIETKIELS